MTPSVFYSASFLITFFLFATSGLLLARHLKSTRVARLIAVFFALIAGVVVAGYIGIHTRLISVFGFRVYLNWVLQSLCIGMALGVCLRILRVLRLTQS